MDLRNNLKKLPTSGKSEDRDFQSLEDFLSNRNFKKPTRDSCPRDFTYLDNLIHSGDKEIVLESDIVLKHGEKSHYERGIKIDVEGLTIDGAGHTIDAKGKGQIFNITGKNITLKNITFRGGIFYENYPHNGGGAIYSKSDCLSIEGCIFFDNASAGYGGAIFNCGSRMNISNSNFLYNLSKWGCAISSRNSEVLVTDSLFEENIGYLGTIFTGRKKRRISKHDIMDGSSLFSMGGIGVIFCDEEGSLFVENSIFKSNYAYYTSTIEMNGNAALSIFNSHFKDNYSYQGNLIRLLDDNIASIVNSRFENNSANKSIVSNYGKFSSFDSCIFEGNDLPEKDSGILSASFGALLSVNDCHFSNSKNNPPAIYIWTSEAKIMNSTFEGRESEITVKEKSLLNNIKFNNSSRFKPIMGRGTIQLYENESVLAKSCDECDVKIIKAKNLDTNQKPFGYLNDLIRSGSEKVELDKDILFDLNNDLKDFHIYGINIDVDGLVIDGCGHTIDAGKFSRIFRISANNVTLKNLKLKNGHIWADGGAIFNEGHNLTIERCIFTKNTVKGFCGGAIYTRNSLNLKQSVFNHNRAPKGKGGAIYYENEDDLNMDKVAFKNNLPNHIFDGFNKRPLRNSEPNRDSNVSYDELRKIHDDSLLAEILLDEPNAGIRRAIINRISDEKILSEIACGRYPREIRIWAASKITGNDALKQVISNSSNWRVRRQATHNISDKEILVDIIRNDPSPFVRRAAIHSCHFSNDSFFEDVFLNDSSKKVRCAALGHIADGDFLARVFDENIGHDEKLCTKALANPNFPIERLSEIAYSNANSKIGKSCINNPNCPEDAIKHIICNGDYFRVRALERLDEDFLKEFSQKHENNSIASMAINYISDGEFLADIFDKNKGRNRNNAVRNPNFPIEKLIDIAKHHSNDHIRIISFNNPNLPEDVLKNIAHSDPSRYIRRAAVKSLDSHDDEFFIYTFMNESDSLIKVAAISHISDGDFLADTFDKYKGYNNMISRAAVRNPNFPAGKLADIARNNPDENIRKDILLNPNLEREVLEYLACHDSSKRVRNFANKKIKLESGFYCDFGLFY